MVYWTEYRTKKKHISTPLQCADKYCFTGSIAHSRGNISNNLSTSVLTCVNRQSYIYFNCIIAYTYNTRSVCLWIHSNLPYAGTKTQTTISWLRGNKPLDLWLQMHSHTTSIPGDYMTCQTHSHLTHWGRVMHICVNKIIVIASDNGLWPGRRQAIIWTNAGIFLSGPLGTNFSEIFSAIHTFSCKKIHLKMSSAKWWPLLTHK